MIYDYLVDDLAHVNEEDRAKYLFSLGIALRNKVQNTVTDVHETGSSIDGATAQRLCDMLDDLGEVFYLATEYWCGSCNYSDGSSVWRLVRLPDHPGGEIRDETEGDGQDRVLELGNPPPGMDIFVAEPLYNFRRGVTTPS